jgi:tetratricopeptide (TPR) repeat protein
VLAAGERPTDYAAHLLAIVRSMTRQDRFADVAPALAQRSSLEGRLVSILRNGQRRDSVSRSRLVVTIGFATLLLVVTTVVHVVAAPEPTDGAIERAEGDRLPSADALNAPVPDEDACQTDLAMLDPNLETVRAASIYRAFPNRKQIPEVFEVSVASPPVQFQFVAGSTSRKNKQDDLNQSGIDFMRDGQFARAIAAFEEEIRQSGSMNAMYNLACAHALHGDKQHAFAALENAIENGFNDTGHMSEDEDLRLLQGDPHFYQLVRLAQDLQLFGSGRLGFGMKDEEDWRRSLPRFERVTREHPKVGRAWTNLGFARLEAGDPKGGTAAYQRALDLKHQTPTTLYNLACCAARAGDVDGAFGWLDRADKAGFEIGEHVGSDTDLDALRGDPRYGAMLDRWDQKMAKEHREKQRDEEKQKTD